MKAILMEITQMMDQMALGEKELSTWLKKSKKIRSVTRLPGDASARKYFRVTSDEATYIVMWMEPFTELKENIPFLAVQRHLAAAGVDVPLVLDVDPERGYLLLEDLGDTTLLRRLQDICTAETERHLYERVIDALVLLQFRASPQRKRVNLEAFQLFFDQEKLMWEVNFTLENFYKLYLKRNFSRQAEKTLTQGFSQICKTLSEQPVVLTHRDFHSRNIMVTPGDNQTQRLVMIDFQDARMGPAQYDLASLLRDSYYQLEESQISLLLDYYVVRYEGMSQKAIDREQFRYIFDLMSVQRNFKAIGSFASFLNRRGDATYLKYIGNTFENIRRVLLKYPQFSALREELFHYYYF